MTMIVLAIRFLLEVTTVLGLFSGVFISKTIPSKILYFLISISITLLWARYGAPKSPNALLGYSKLFLEICVYSIGSIAFYKLFGNNIGTTYLTIATLNLIFMYALRLQGH